MKVFDLFSGCGGFRTGFARAGYEFVGYCEIDKHASKLYKAYYDTTNEVYYNDARTIDTKTMPNFDVLVGGFPCQSFSVAGARLGFGDKRGNLIFEVARILRDKRPRYFLLENVKGLLSSGGGDDFAKILELLADSGDYSIEWALLNSKDYGVAQNRERVYIAGFPRGKRPGQIFPLSRDERKNNSSNPCNLIYWKNSKDKWVDELKTYTPALKTQSDLCRQTLLKTGTLRTHKDDNGFRPSKKNICPTIPARARTDGSGQPVIMILPILTPEKLKVRQNGRRIKTDGEPMFTITAQDRHGVIRAQALAQQAFTAGGGGYDPHEIQIRRLTPLECFRLQGFPDDIVKKAYEIGISDAQLYKMAGNAVTVNVIELLAQKIKDIDET